jgi:hypothetical protein
MNGEELHFSVHTNDDDLSGSASKISALLHFYLFTSVTRRQHLDTDVRSKRQGDGIFCPHPL